MTDACDLLFARELAKCLHKRKIPIYLISGGFTCIIEMVAKSLDIPKENIFANKLLFYYDGKYISHFLKKSNFGRIYICKWMIWFDKACTLDIYVLCSLNSQSCLNGITGSIVGHRSGPPEFRTRHGHVWRVFNFSLCLVTAGGCSAHLAYFVAVRNTVSKHQLIAIPLYLIQGSNICKYFNMKSWLPI